MPETLTTRLRALPYDEGRAWQGRPAAVLLAFSPAAPRRRIAPDAGAEPGDRPADRADGADRIDHTGRADRAGHGDHGGPGAHRGAGVPDDLDIVLVRRPASMRHHAGQIGFPGGAVEETDVDGIAAALREAREEIGLDPAKVDVLGSAGRVPVAVSGFDVELVLGLWDGTGPLVPSPREVDGILRPTLLQLADPANHATLPLAELVGPERAAARQLPPEAFSPVFHVDGHIVWGFTAGVLSELLAALALPGPPLPPAWPRTGSPVGRRAAAADPANPADSANITHPRR